MVEPDYLEEGKPLIVGFVGVVIKLNPRIQSPLLLAPLVRPEQALWFPLLLAVVGGRRPLNLVCNTLFVQQLLRRLKGRVAVKSLLTQAVAKVP